MDERLRFVARALEGEQMAGLCREFGISRKTGYKLVGALILGLVAGELRRLSRSLIPAMLFHALLNAASALWPAAKTNWRLSSSSGMAGDDGHSQAEGGA